MGPHPGFHGWFPGSGLICCSDGFLLAALGPNFIRAYPFNWKGNLRAIGRASDERCSDWRTGADF